MEAAAAADADLGLRYQLPGVVDERDSLELAPVLTGTAQQTLLSNATLNFAGGSAGNPWYNREKKDFAPNIGFAWDVFGNGKTALRGGYSMSYVNDQAILAPENLLESNAGLQGLATDTGLGNRVSTGLPAIVAPDYQVPLTVADNYANNPFNTVGMIDPNLRHPRVQQYSVGMQHDFKGTVFEARYVGNHVVGAYRAFDYNQVVINSNGFLQDFLRAQKNGFLAQAAGGGFNPAYNANIPGSQPLTVFPKLAKGALTDANALFYLQTGEVGELASYYQTNGYNPTNAVPFFQNPNALGTDYLTNYSSSSYNALQVEVRHRTKSGFFFEANYTWSKVLSDADGEVQNRLQHFLDIANPKIERSRANFDLTHMIKVDGYYELPFGKGHKLSYRPLDRVIGGWILGGTMTWQSGAPFSILSGRGTLNRESRSYYNTADTSLTKGQLDSVVKFQMTGNGPMMITQSAINRGWHGREHRWGAGLQRADLLQSRRRDAGRAAAADVRRSLDLHHGHAVEEGDPDHGDEEDGTGDGGHQRAQPRHVLVRRPEHQLHHFRRDQFHVLPAARGAVRCTLHILMPPLWEQLAGARVYDLGQPYFTGMPHWPAHPPFLFGLTKQHGDMVGPAGNSSAADAMALGSHVGTHIDALCHFSCGGKLHGGHAVEESAILRRRAAEVFGGHGRADLAPRRAARCCGRRRAAGGGFRDHAASNWRRRGRPRSGPATWCCCARGGRATSRTRGSS